jgi:uncharacterized protein (DUF1499 family)
MNRIAIFAGALGFWLSIAGVIGMILSPLGFRFGVWDFAVALRTVLKFATFAALAGVALSLIGLVLAKLASPSVPVGRAFAGLIIGGIFAGYVVAQFNKVQSLPYIHDITTDTANPPTFVALADARKASANGLEYQGAEIAGKQKQAYPEIVPLSSQLPPVELFKKAETAARMAGWEIAAADAQAGRIEATATSLIYRFKDDIVIRITPAGNGSQLDMRSMSRVGQSDVGTNAKRIREFIVALKVAGV